MNGQQSILDAMLAQYVTPYTGMTAAATGFQQPQMAPQQPGAPQMSPAGPQPLQQGPQQPQMAPGPQMGPQPPENPLEDVESALAAGLSQEPDATDRALAFEAGVQPFEEEWENTQEQNWRGVAGGIEWIVDKVREKRLRPQRQAVNEARGRMTYNANQEKQHERIKARARALVEVGNSPEAALAIASTTGADESFDVSKYDKRLDPTAEARDRASRAEFLRKNPELSARLSQRDKDKFWTMGSLDTGGMSLQVGPNGEILFSENGETSVMEWTPAAESELQKSLINVEGSKATMNRIMNNSRRSYLETMGRAGTKVGNLLDKAGFSDNQLAEYAAERSAWANEIAQEVMQFRKEITGVAGGPQEMAKIEAMFANPDMGPEQFARNMEMLVSKYQDEANASRIRLNMDEVEYEPFKFTFGDEQDDQWEEIAPGIRRKKT